VRAIRGNVRRLRNFESTNAFFGDQKIDKIQTVANACWEAHAGRPGGG
jgi:hypothetical protein